MQRYGAHGVDYLELAPAPFEVFEDLLPMDAGGKELQAGACGAGAAGSESQPYLEGGIEAWRDAGQPTRKDPRQPIEIMRQVQIGAGSLVVAGYALGMLVHPGFHVVSGLVGTGLILAGVTGFCGMARLLALAPWNRRTAAPAR